MELNEKAKSKAQQRFFGMVRATQKGEMENPSSEVSQVATSMSKTDVKKMAKTKHEGLPEKKKVDEGVGRAAIGAGVGAMVGGPVGAAAGAAIGASLGKKKVSSGSGGKKKPKNFFKAEPKVTSSQEESFEINKSAHKAAQKKSKMRNLARGNENTNEKAAAQKKAGGPKLYGEGAAWTKKSGKNKEGGLNEKGRKSYERENPGSDLKAPQPEGGSRKKSFCARMGGMKKKLTSAKTANDPDSRINKSLRKWKCNEESQYEKGNRLGFSGDLKTDAERYRVPRGPGGNPKRIGDKVRSFNDKQPLGQLKVKYGADKVREYYKKNKGVDEGYHNIDGEKYLKLPKKVAKGVKRDSDERHELGKVKDAVTDTLGMTNTKRDGVKKPSGVKGFFSMQNSYEPEGGIVEVASYKDFTKNAREASARVNKERQDRKDANAKSAYKDRVTKGVRFYDKKGKGHIRDGKKVYS